MVKIGIRQDLKINNITDFGLYLDAETGEKDDNILLPQNEIGELKVKVGDILNVFIYCDTEDRVIATLKEVPISVGKLALLEVVDITNIGYFLNMNLQKDLFLPKGQESFNLEIGNKYLVGMYEDKKGRLAATMQIKNFLHTNDKYVKNDKVTGTVYDIEDGVGAFVAIDNKYFGLIPQNEYFKDYKIGHEIEARIIRIREDGKIDITPRELAFLQSGSDSKKILTYLKNNKGTKLNDKSDPKFIKENFGISKKAFKRAIGKLLKEHKITKDDKNIFSAK